MRKELKNQAKKILKKHYLLYVFICLISVFLGIEFYNSNVLIGNIEDRIINTKRIVSKIDNNKIIDKKIVDKVDKEKEKMFTTKRGVLANLVNGSSFNKLTLKVSEVIVNVTHKKTYATFILTFLGFMFSFLMWMFIENMYVVVSRRFFLEGRSYDNLSSDKFIFIIRARKWINVSVTMLLKFVLQLLWSLTIIGGIIKYYSYFLVPYILAENPSIKPVEAISLSNRMMNGNKFKFFIANLSFIGYEVLGIFTLGLSNILYLNPYKTAFFTEYYVKLREISKKERIENINLLNDEYLYKKAPKEKINNVYKEIVELEKKKVKVPKQTGFRNFLNKKFGITLFNKEYNDAYEEEQLRFQKIKIYEKVLSGKYYPDRLFPIIIKERKKRIDNINYLKSYSIFSLVLMFFIFSFIGWVWEVSLNLLSDGIFVNRGTLHGPWLPIYGFGGIFILTLLNKYRNNPKLEFLLIVVVCAIIEYFTSLYLEVVYDGVRWWDYTGYFININGRICAEGLLAFGFGGVLGVYILAPLLDDKIKKIKSKLLTCLCVLLITLFVSDILYSYTNPNCGKGISSKLVINLKYKL